MGRRSVFTVLLAALAALLSWLLLRASLSDDVPGSANVERVGASAGDGTGRGRTKVHAAPATEASPAAPGAPGGESLVTGVVLDAAGSPVVAARVLCHPDDLTKPVALGTADAAGQEAQRRSFSATTGADGRFSVRIDERAVQAILTVTADAGFGQAEARPRDRDLTVRLDPWACLHGTVTNAERERIGGATVTLHLLIDALTEDRTAVTAADGSYRIDRVPPTAWSSLLTTAGRGRQGWVVVEAAGYAPRFVTALGALAGRRVAEDGRLDVELARGMTLTGRVVDGDTRDPIAGATVVCWSDEGAVSFGGPAGSLRNPFAPRPLGETTTAADGSYRFEHLPVDAPGGPIGGYIGKRGLLMGHAAAWKEGYAFDGGEIPALKDGAETETDFVLWPCATVTGRVVDPAGNPVDGATVSAGVAGRTPTLNGFPSFYAESDAANVRTGPDGRYSLRTLRASRSGPTTARISAHGRWAKVGVKSDVVEVAVRPGDVLAAPDLVVDPGSVPRAVFVVTDEHGAPVPGAVIAIGTDSTRSGLDGRAQWSPYHRLDPGAAPSAVRALVRARGRVARIVEFTPAYGTPAEVSIELRPGARVAGVVLLADGNPARGAQVHVADGTLSVEAALGDGSFRVPPRDPLPLGRFAVNSSARADSEGVFSVDDLPEGPYHVAAQVPSNAPGASRKPRRVVQGGVAAGTTDLVLTIPPETDPTQPLELTVTDADGVSIDTATAEAVIGDSRAYARRAGGRLRFDGLPPGRGTISVFAAGWVTATLDDVEVQSDAAPAPRDVRMERGIALRAVLRPAAGSLPADATVTFQRLDAGRGDRTVSGAVRSDGSYEGTGFVPGRYRVTVHGALGRTDGARWVAEGNLALTVPDGVPQFGTDVRLVEAGGIAVVVRDARLPDPPHSGGGTDAEKERFGAGSRTEILDGAGEPVEVLTPLYAKSGRHIAIAPGDYTVRVTLDGEAPQEARVTVRAGETTSVTFPAR